nr:MAG TPA: hypothetical protein [Caudoviricetes sp.]
MAAFLISVPSIAVTSFLIRRAFGGLAGPPAI